MANLPNLMRRHWLPSTLFVLCAIFSYTKSPLYGADPTPTPNVSTVPKPGQIFTPTPPPTPAIVIITREAPPTATSAAPGNQPGNNNEGTTDTESGNVSPTTNAGANVGSAPNSNAAGGLPSAPGSAPITGVIIAEQINLRQAPNTTAAILATLVANTPVTLLGRTEAADWFYLCCGGQPPQNGWVSAPFVQITSGDWLTLPLITGNQPEGLSADKPTVALTVAVTPTLIWQGALIQWHVLVQNTSAITLTNLTLHQPLPAALIYQTGTSDRAGNLRLEATTGNDRQVRIDWASLPPAATATALMTLQVEPTTPNGLLFDSRTMVVSSEGATAAVALTLAMPPAILPHFRK